MSTELEDLLQTEMAEPNRTERGDGDACARAGRHGVAQGEGHLHGQRWPREGCGRYYLH